MKLKILHSSDLHGNYKKLLTYAGDFDVWVDTGDFCPNYGRGPKTAGLIIPEHERRHQIKWWRYKNLGTRFREWLKGRPGVIIPGNHDFVPYGHLLEQAGSRIFNASPTGFRLLDLKWAGFREITWIGMGPNGAPEWVGEVKEINDQLARTFEFGPDILVTHNPPHRILDYDPPWDRCWGWQSLDDALTHRPHRIKHHFFGHVHPQGGKTAIHGRTKFYNGSERVILHECEIS